MTITIFNWRFWRLIWSNSNTKKTQNPKTWTILVSLPKNAQWPNQSTNGSKYTHLRKKKPPMILLILKLAANLKVRTQVSSTRGENKSWFSKKKVPDAAAPQKRCRINLQALWAVTKFQDRLLMLKDQSRLKTKLLRKRLWRLRRKRQLRTYCQKIRSIQWRKKIETIIILSI